ncbi:MAG: hypothetical protein P1P74_09680 [Desulfuromonadales bacterium]|nr:hypothetical protein [Desulfuromonadales bacterium]
MQYPRKFLITLLTAALIFPATLAWAAPQVELSMSTEKNVTITKNGEQVVKRIPTVEAMPGETLIFTITYKNTGDEPATNVIVNNPLPTGTIYLPGSATEINDLSFSIDHGETFKKPSMLTYEVSTPDGSKEKRTATPEQYTHIRWQFPTILAGEQGSVSYKLRVP